MASPSARPRPVEPAEHPALAALRLAPVDDEPVTEADRAALAEGRRDLAAGRTVRLEVLARELGVDLDQA